MKTRTTPAWKTVTRAGIAFGAVLVLAALVVRDIRAQAFVQTHTISLVLLIAGAAIALGCLASNYDLILDLVRHPRTALGANTAAQVVLALALAALVCYIGSVRFARFDMTGSRRYTLHSKTSRMLRSLEQPVEVTVVYIEPTREELMVDLQAQLTAWGYEQATEMLDSFEALSRQVTVRELDVEDQRAVRELSARVDIPGACVVFESGERHDVIPLVEIVEAPDWQGASPRFTGEAAFASALAKIVEGKMQTVYFLTGHGERPLEGQPTTREMSRTADVFNSDGYSLSRLVAKLKADNFESRTLDLSETGSVPPDCDVLVIAGPRIPLPREHLDAIRLYMQSPEGRLIAMVDSILLEPEAATNVGELLAESGVAPQLHAVAMTLRLVPDLSLGRVVEVAEDQIVIGRSGCAEHPVTSDLQNYQIAFVGCAPLELAATPPRPGVSVRALLTAEESSWGERTRWRSPSDRASAKYDAGQDVAGPVVTAAVVEPAAPGAMPFSPAPQEQAGPKMLVVGSSFSFVNESVAQSPPNLYLILNAVNWLAGKGHMVGIPARDIDINRVTISAAQVRLGRWLFALGLPLLVVAAGVVVWQVRRR